VVALLSLGALLPPGAAVGGQAGGDAAGGVAMSGRFDHLHAAEARSRGISVEQLRAIQRANAEAAARRDYAWAERDPLDDCDTCTAYVGRIRPYFGACPECGAGECAL
jgi:hypothetical protein